MNTNIFGHRSSLLNNCSKDSNIHESFLLQRGTQSLTVQNSVIGKAPFGVGQIQFCSFSDFLEVSFSSFLADFFLNIMKELFDYWRAYCQRCSCYFAMFRPRDFSLVEAVHKHKWFLVQNPFICSTSLPQGGVLFCSFFFFFLRCQNNVFQTLGVVSSKSRERRGSYEIFLFPFPAPWGISQSSQRTLFDRFMCYMYSV